MWWTLPEGLQGLVPYTHERLIHALARPCVNLMGSDVSTAVVQAFHLAGLPSDTGLLAVVGERRNEQAGELSFLTGFVAMPDVAAASASAGSFERRDRVVILNHATGSCLCQRIFIRYTMSPRNARVAELVDARDLAS